jgi:deoxyribodipyrimidine photolyase-related protein
MMNLGLLTADEVLTAALTSSAAEDPTRRSSIEGFVRQVLGWREFVRGLDSVHGEHQDRHNHWGHQRGLTDCWWRGGTGIPPLDTCIQRCLELGWSHHIDRLMVAGNLMLLLGVAPRSAWRWFMAMFSDSADWVMGPNVFGMALMSDGGLFATKPYVCSSAYLRRMGSYAAGPWCDEVDGLYWEFIANHRQELSQNPRMAMPLRGLERLPVARRERLATAAAAARERLTTPTA